MDLAPFSEESFDTKKWINDVFKGQDKRDQHASSLVMRLQLAIQEVNTSLEDTSQQVLSSLPRIVRDVDSLGQEASLLKTQMAALMADVKKAGNTTGRSSLDTLVRLDQLKSRLMLSSQALRQADNWTTLATEVEEVLEAGDLEAAAAKVVQLQRCLSVLCQTPDSEDRAALLNSFQLRIEAMASPHVVEAFTHHNLAESIKHSRILRLVGRSSQAQGYYLQCTLAVLALQWVEGQDGEAACLQHYYDTLATLLHRQVAWVAEVFPDTEPRLMLCQLATAAVTDLDPPIHQVVSNTCKLQEDPLQFLCGIRGVMDDFLRQARHTLVGRADDAAMQSACVALSSAVYAPLAHHLAPYGGYEKTRLLAHLAAADVPRQDVSDTMLRLRDYSAKMRQQCDQAAGRCGQVSGMAGCSGLVAGAGCYVAGVVAILAETRLAVAGLQQDITHDWTIFSTCLDLLHTAGVVLVAVEDCDEGLSYAVGRTELCHPPPPFVLSPALLLQETDSLAAYVGKIRDSSSGALEAPLAALRRECSNCVSSALATITAPLRVQLAPLPHLPVWGAHQSSSALSAALAPQEYVTQMGQYLLTLPQHLEPLLVSPSPALNRALQQLEETHSSGQRAVSESEVSAADFLIGRVAQATCSLYAAAVLQIPHLQQHAGAQLVTDIEYITNILEDLGVGCVRPLDHLLQLLRAAPRDYGAVSEGLQGPSLRMVAAVRQLRDISGTS